MTNPQRARVEWLLDEVARLTDADPVYLRESRENRFSDSRHAVWWVLHEYELWSTLEIGRMVDRDHSTVTHGLNHAKRRQRVDRDYAALCATLAARYFAWRSEAALADGQTLQMRPDRILELARAMVAIGEQLSAVGAHLIDHIEAREPTPVTPLTRGRERSA